MPSLALTFDDGPDAAGTPQLLDLLGDLGAKVTFFPIAPRAAAQPQLIERMLAEGHTVGVHCTEHVRHTERSAEWLRADTATAVKTLRDLGVEPSLWRAPYGVLAPWSEEVAGEHTLRLVGWNVDTHDWSGDPAEEIFARTGSDLTDGAVVLAHDGIGPGAHRETVQETIAFVQLAAAHAQANDLRLEALS